MIQRNIGAVIYQGDIRDIVPFAALRYHGIKIKGKANSLRADVGHGISRKLLTKAHRMEERVKEFVNSFTNYLFVLKNAQNGGNPKPPHPKMSKMRKGRPLRIDFAVIFRLILLLWKMTGISSIVFARPQLRILGSLEVSLAVYRFTMPPPRQYAANFLQTFPL